MIGPGKYDDVCTQVREQTQAEGVVLIIADGKLGSGFSMQAPIDLHAALPGVLEGLAERIRTDWTAGENADPMSEYQTAAFMLLTLGKAAGMLSREDLKAGLVASLRAGKLSPEYLVYLRDKIDAVLRESKRDDNEGQPA
ncbi:MAG TPA: hypothetical protein VJO99_07115 [Burkholderiaceae bacterium]|nr:hypothetical protein [Burkholderiaceae bacterium]